MANPPRPNRDPGRVTMRALAKMVGVSVQCVSLALRNQPSIGLETRQRIQALARKLGYTPDPALVKLMHHLRSKRHRKIVASVCFLTTRSSDTPDIYCDLLLEGAIEAAQQAGFSHQVAHVNPDKLSGERLQRMLRARGVEGLLLMPMADVQPLDDLLDWGAFCVVSATRSVTSPHFDLVVPDHFTNAATVCDRLQAAGFRRPGLVIESQHDARCGYRLTGALAWHGLYGGMNPTRAHRYDQLGKGAFTQWLETEKPDVLVVALDRTAVELKQLGIPTKNLPIVTCSARPGSNGAFPFTGTFDNPRRIGGVAVEILARKITVGHRGIPTHANSTLILGDWVDGIEAGSRRRARPAVRARKRRG